MFESKGSSADGSSTDSPHSPAAASPPTADHRAPCSRDARSIAAEADGAKTTTRGGSSSLFASTKRSRSSRANSVMGWSVGPHTTYLWRCPAAPAAATSPPPPPSPPRATPAAPCSPPRAGEPRAPSRARRSPARSRVGARTHLPSAARCKKPSSSDAPASTVCGGGTPAACLASVIRRSSIAIGRCRRRRGTRRPRRSPSR